MEASDPVEKALLATDFLLRLGVSVQRLGDIFGLLLLAQEVLVNLLVAPIDYATRPC